MLSHRPFYSGTTDRDLRSSEPDDVVNIGQFHHINRVARPRGSPRNLLNAVTYKGGKRIT